ncbi:Crp/Fnr family transcriptional regulator [Amycolatopsis regifaucium]|uniref:Cyclic nucleotide-binding protein n=1 Tax=Amycolatopsis regifaucium TaxID=546365 RepID=A0A154MRQ3_9PSEU|nr:Crp/Fnr family transcriptional regulator [Amycolatopsis regifaucium]KZB86974.1 cyclic nucleotide-binding protein [Amycolatopsis regifaucium]OKA09403.1 cyclic nucleotide-binding protein [Amycolatopsis regifaucium]SFH60298.1 cAMP-binding domain of CRP or a regulatory subunit of cAMP-dependent protein kinases [Amycolatopsis regifaucium]
MTGPPAGEHGELGTWRRLTPAEQTALRNAGHLKVWRPGQILALQGSPPTSMFVVLRGWVKISATNYRGEDAPLAARGPAEIVGELAPISGLPRSATMSAIDEVHTLIVPREQFLGVLRAQPRIAEEIFRTAAIRLQQSDRLRLESGGPDFPQRLAAVLLELALQHALDPVDGKQVDLHFNQGELAGFARVSRSTLIRGLDELRRLGVVRTARQRVTITRPRALRELAAGRPPPPEED